MSSRWYLRALWAAAAAAMLCGAALSLGTLRLRRSVERRLTTRQDDLRRLQELAVTAAQDRALVRDFERAAPAPAGLDAILRTALPQETANVREIEARPAVPGWTVRKMEVAFGNLDLAKLPAFLAEAQKQRPAWRLAECQIHAAPQAPGWGRVTLVFEGLARTPASPGS